MIKNNFEDKLNHEEIQKQAFKNANEEFAKKKEQLGMLTKLREENAKLIALQQTIQLGEKVYNGKDLEKLLEERNKYKSLYKEAKNVVAYRALRGGIKLSGVSENTLNQADQAVDYLAQWHVINNYKEYWTYGFGIASGFLAVFTWNAGKSFLSLTSPKLTIGARIAKSIQRTWKGEVERIENLTLSTRDLTAKLECKDVEHEKEILRLKHRHSEEIIDIKENYDRKIKNLIKN